MPFASSSDSEQRGLKRKTTDSAVEHSSSPDSRAKRCRSSPERFADLTEEVPQASSNQTSNSASDGQVLFRPDGKFYYDSGDMFLVVEHTFFCVHSTKLKAAGGIFEDLLSRNVRPSEEEFLYGLPALYVPMVSLRQFRFFLAYIYGAIDLKTKPRPDHRDGSDDSRLYWEAAIALLDVSTKLNLCEIRKATISALECLFPTDITGDQVPKFRPVIAGYRHQSDEKMFYRTFPIKAIKLFHEHGVPSMLPMAYYHAAQLSVEDIVNGVEDDGVLLKLDSIDTMKVLKGREKLRRSRRLVLFPWFENKIDQGSESATCEGELMLNNNFCWENFMDIYFQFNRSGFLDDMTNGLQGLSGTAESVLRRYLCATCWSESIRLISAGERKNWEDLPDCFGFESWNSVKKLQESADRSWNGEY